MSVCYAITLLFMCNHFCYILAMASEPECMCSRYHYEESLLEKMIRGEIKFEDLKQSVEKDIVGMNERFVEMKRSITEQLVSIKQTNDEFQQSALNQQAEMKASTASALDKVEKTLTDIEDVKDSIKIPTIAFSSKQVPDTILAKNQVIIFSYIVFDHGNGYDRTTGVFTAPTGGVYLFTVHLCANNKKNIHYSIVVDGTELTTGKNFENDNAHVCSTATLITILRDNQKVWVKSKINGDQLYQDVYRWNIFSGVLIHP